MVHKLSTSIMVTEFEDDLVEIRIHPLKDDMKPVIFDIYNHDEETTIAAIKMIFAVIGADVKFEVIKNEEKDTNILPVDKKPSDEN